MLENFSNRLRAGFLSASLFLSPTAHAENPAVQQAGMSCDDYAAFIKAMGQDIKREESTLEAQNASEDKYKVLYNMIARHYETMSKAVDTGCLSTLQGQGIKMPGYPAPQGQ